MSDKLHEGCCHTEPDDSHSSTNEHCKLRSMHTKCGSTIDGEVDPLHRTDVPIEHGWNAYQRMSDEHGQNRETWIQSLRHGGRRHCKALVEIRSLKVCCASLPGKPYLDTCPSLVLTCIVWDMLSYSHRNTECFSYPEAEQTGPCPRPLFRTDRHWLKVFVRRSFARHGVGS